MTRGTGKKVAVGVAMIGLVAVAFWAGRVTMQPATVPTDLPASEVLADVTEQTVGRTLNLNVTVAQPKRALAVNTLTGVVTEIRAPGEVAQGDVLYRVAGVPVRAVAGDLPFFRALNEGHRGLDVRQLEDALVSLGYLTRADDRFDAATARAVRAWQLKLG